MRWRPDLRSVGLVTLVTLLVWVWAEGESLRRESVTGSIRFSGRSDLIVKPDPSFGGTVEVGLEGSNLAVTAANRRLIAGALELKPGEGAVPSEPGTHTLTLRNVIREHPELRTRGVTVTGVEPVRLTIDIVRLVTREMPVRAVLPPGFEDSQNVTVRPPTLLVTMPEPLAASLPPDAALLVRVRESDLREGLAGLAGTRRPISNLQAELPPELAGKPEVKPEQRPVEVTVEVRSQMDSYEVPTVPVWVALPPTQTDRWTVELQDQFLSNVMISGPRDLIGRVRSGDLVIKAIVELDTQDLEAKIQQKAVRFSLLPTGLNFPEPRPVVRLNIRPRAEAGVNGG